MRVYWKALFGYGFVFWIVLCITDFLGLTNIHNSSGENVGELYDYVKATNFDETLKETSKTFTFEYKGYKFSWPHLLWNTLTFVVSIILCSIGRVMVLGTWKQYQTFRNQAICSQVVTPRSLTLQRSHSTLSKIPIMVKSASLRGSEDILKNEQSITNQKQSCPNLLSKRSGSSLSNLESKKLKTLYSNESFNLPKNTRLVEQLEKQVQHYKEEFLRLQSSSLKEHAALSRKLEQVYKERTDLFKQLTITQKETRGAKQQLEELLQEKTDLLKKMEQATKELKANTKTKKVAFAKLEEVTSNIEELRVQLEQVNRDKEIVGKKLRLMEGEYNKLHERYIATQEKIYNSEIDENVPEKDRNISKVNSNSNEYCDTIDGFNSALKKNTVDALASVSQTQLDMEKIQDKIKQLEKNLKNLNYSTQNLTSQRVDVESELSLSAEPTSDSLTKDEESGYSENGSPRKGQFDWPNKVMELIGRNKNKFSQIQDLAIKLREKTEILDKLRYTSRKQEDSSADEELSSSDEAEPTRIVSNSAAFKHFLKGLNVTEPKGRNSRNATDSLFK